MKEGFIHPIWPTYHSTSRLVPHASVVHIPIYVGSYPIYNGRRPMSCQFTNGRISKLRTGDLFKLVTRGPTPPLPPTVQRTVLGYAPSPAIGPRHWIHVYPPSLLLYRDGDKARAGRCFSSTVLVSPIFGSYGQQWDVAG
jgi:hypothetical protein